MAIDTGTVIDAAVRSDQINSGGLPIDMEAKTYKLNPNAYPFEALVRAIGGKKGCDQMKHEFRERRLIPGSVNLTAAVAVGDSTLTVDNPTFIKNDMILVIAETEEVLLVQDTSITSTFDVVRLSGSGTIQNAAVNGGAVIICGESHAEGEEVPAAYTNDSISRFNYIMQKDRRISVTDIEEAIKHYDESEKRDSDRAQAFVEFKREQDLLMYVGKGSREIVSASGPRRHCMSGVMEQFTENAIDLSGAGGTLTLQALTNAMSLAVSTNGGSEGRYGMFGVNAWRQISAWPKEYLRDQPGEKKTWGTSISKFITGFGNVQATYDRALSASYGLADRFFLMDLEHIQQLYLNGAPVRLFMDIPNLSGLHSKVDAISGTFGLQVEFPELHVAGKGVK